MTTTTSRRAVLAGIAASPIANLPALAAQSGDDPIYAVITEHEASYHPVVALERLQRELEDKLPRNKTCTSIRVGIHDIVETDDPRWVALARDWHAAFYRHHAAEWALVDTSPTTRPGLLALLAYLAKHQARERIRFGEECSYYAWPNRRIGMREADDTDKNLWQVRLIESLARAATKAA